MDDERNNIQEQQCVDPCCNKEFLDLEGLRVFHDKTQEYTDAGDQANADEIDKLDERVKVTESTIVDLEGTTNELTINVDELRFLIEHGYFKPGENYKVSPYPQSGETDSLVTSDGIYHYTNAKTAYVVCEGGDDEVIVDSGSTYPVFDIYLTGYDTTTTGGALKVKMLNKIGGKVENVFFRVNTWIPTISGTTFERTLTRKLYLNGRPANYINTWRVGDVLYVWYDGEYFQATHAHIERPQSKYPIFFGFDDPTAKDRLNVSAETVDSVLNIGTDEDLNYNIVEPIRKASGSYGTCVNQVDGQRLYILIPEDVEQPEVFNVGGI